MRQRQISLFDDQRLDLDGAIDLSLASLNEYGQRYRIWSIAYSGGKDSSATVAFVAWAINTGLVQKPDKVVVLYSDTRLELPPLQQTAIRLMQDLKAEGVDARIVMPSMEDRFFCYMLGYGVPPSSNTFRWCTPKLKVEPMERELYSVGVDHYLGAWGYDIETRERGYSPREKMLMLTGVRQGESAARDQRIALSCSKDSGECGQGWFQSQTDQAVADTLAPLLHWRLCHVYDWLYFESDKHGYDVSDIAAIYGDGDVRTGCVGCPLASRDTALERLVKQDGWNHLTPLLELKPLYRELKKPKWRKRKHKPERRKDGQYSKKVQRLGPLTMEARAYGLETVLDIQRRSGMDLINSEEEAYIRSLWAADAWPRKWTGDEITGDKPIDAIRLTKTGELVTQSLLV